MTASSSAAVTIRPLAPADKARWSELFRAYRDFYHLDPSDEVVARVWGWLQDPAHECSAFIAEVTGDSDGDANESIVAIAHYRRFSRPSTGTVGIWLDDLFTAPEARGRGAAGALIRRLTELADAEERSIVRWITAADNHRAQGLYDRVAARTGWVTYDAAPAPAAE